MPELDMARAFVALANDDAKALAVEAIDSLVEHVRQLLETAEAQKK